MNSFTPVEPKWNPIVFADERAAWEGRPADRPDLTFRVEAAAYHGRPVFFAISGPWTHSARSAPVAPSGFNAAIEWLASLIMPGLMLAGRSCSPGTTSSFSGATAWGRSAPPPSCSSRA